MVNAQQFLIVFSLFSITSNAISSPLNVPELSIASSSSNSQLRNEERDIIPQAKYLISRNHLGVARPSRKRGPSAAIGFSTIDLEIHERASSSPIGGNDRRKRAVDVNGTEVNLGSSQNTFVVPVSIGSPPSIYPLQLDLASSDLFLASTLCTTSSCPTSLGPNVNAYYDVLKGSNGYEEVNGNRTFWNSSYADGTVASGIVIKEMVTLGEVVLEGQVMGLINSTNLTLSEQKISGILGLGFPRLSSLSHILLKDRQETSSSSTLSSISASSSGGSATTPASSSSPTYLPPVLENIVRTPHIPYPVFALALAPPPLPPNSSATSTSSSAIPSSTSRYQSKFGSLTLGGVSNHYISNQTGSGRTIDDIEWHEVVPFGKARSISNDTVGALSRTLTGSATPTSALSASSSSTASASSGASSSRRKRSSTSQLNGFPSNLNELGEEEYLFWAIELRNISLNGTIILPNSSYPALGGSSSSLALLDIGFNGISGPQQDVIRIFNGIRDARQVSEGRWVVPCNTKMTLGFSFGGRYIQLQPSDWISTQVDGSSFCLAWPIVAPSTGDGLDWQLGTPFLKKVYSIFSYGINGLQAPLVGFLPLEDDPVTSSTSTANVNSTAFNPNSPTPTTISELSLTTTIKTVLPNNIIPDPTYTTPGYVYQTTPAALQPGITQYMGLANSSAYTIDKVPIISLDSAATSRIASMAGGGGQNGGSAAGGGASSGASKVISMGGLGMGIVLIGGIFGVLA